MTSAERETFEVPSALRGTSIPILKRVSKKIYGPDKGPEVVNDLFAFPLNVVPVVLARMKQKDEEWRYSQVCAIPIPIPIPTIYTTMRPILTNSSYSANGRKCGTRRLKICT